MYVDGSSLSLSRCIFDNVECGAASPGWGGVISDADARSVVGNGTISVDSCVLYNLKAPSGWGGLKIFNCQKSTMTVNNTTVYAAAGGTSDNQLYYIADTYPNGTINIKNSIITCDSGNCIAGGGYPTYVAAYSYCCLHAFPSLPAGAGNTLSDPLLVDPANGNFKLRPTSPCIGTGTII
jgi:hypothetical protein